ncbi:MAG: DNA repair protein RecO [Candidatus Aureabacteria bacterium]|nr:DNA repair protein RecO [Candidatus Auribacterota bacterium]
MIRTVQGIILHRREVTESSLILTVFSDVAGKLDLLAKGARRSTSRFLGHLELFSLCSLTYYENLRRGINILSECDVIDPLLHLRADFSAFMAACYFAELVGMGTGLASSARTVFDLLKGAFSHLASLPDPSLLERYFELHLLSLLGYSLQVSVCVCCRKKERRPRFFSARAGGMVCDDCRGRHPGAMPISQGTLSTMRYLKARPIRSLPRVALTAQQSSELEEILRRAIVFYLEREPRSLRTTSVP